MTPCVTARAPGSGGPAAGGAGVGGGGDTRSWRVPGPWADRNDPSAAPPAADCRGKDV